MNNNNDANGGAANQDRDRDYQVRCVKDSRTLATYLPIFKDSCTPIAARTEASECDVHDFCNAAGK
jgi:hypothetical protein